MKTIVKCHFFHVIPSELKTIWAVHKRLRSVLIFTNKS